MDDPVQRKTRIKEQLSKSKIPEVLENHLRHIDTVFDVQDEESFRLWCDKLKVSNQK